MIEHLINLFRKGESHEIRYIASDLLFYYDKDRSKTDIELKNAHGEWETRLYMLGGDNVHEASRK